MNLYQIHGILQLLAFLVLFPIGVVIALMRNTIGPKWLIYHIFFQISAALCVFIASALVIIAEKGKKESHDHEDNKPLARLLHVWNGRIVVTLIFLQLLWAFFGKFFVPLSLWYMTHITFAILILLGGFAQVILAYLMYSSKK